MASGQAAHLGERLAKAFTNDKHNSKEQRARDDELHNRHPPLPTTHDIDWNVEPRHSQPGEPVHEPGAGVFRGQDSESEGGPCRVCGGLLLTAFGLALFVAIPLAAMVILYFDFEGDSSCDSTMEVWANVLFALSMVNLVMLCIGICCRKALPKACPRASTPGRTHEGWWCYLIPLVIWVGIFIAWYVFGTIIVFAGEIANSECDETLYDVMQTLLIVTWALLAAFLVASCCAFSSFSPPRRSVNYHHHSVSPQGHKRQQPRHVEHPHGAGHGAAAGHREYHVQQSAAHHHNNGHHQPHYASEQPKQQAVHV